MALHLVGNGSGRVVNPIAQSGDVLADALDGIASGEANHERSKNSND